MTEPRLRDARERAAALDATRSFIVQAPAGSGKTELLIQRCLALLARVERPEAVVAVTFTRKAAGEIRERIVRALREPDPPGDAEPSRLLTARLARAVLQRDAAAGWNLLSHPARLQIHTIDALCMALVRQAPLTAKLGALPRPIERAESLHVEAAREELFAAGSRDEAWRRLLDYLDNDGEQAVRLIADLLAKREQWLRHLVQGDPAKLRDQLERALDAEIGRALGALAALLPRDSRDELERLARYAAGNLPADHPLAAFRNARTRDASRDWRAIASWLLTARGTLIRAVDRSRGFPAADAREPLRAERKRAMESLLETLAGVPDLARMLQLVRTLPPPRYDDAAWALVEGLLEVLPRAAAQLEVVFARRGVIDFNEATLVALRALGDDERPSDLLLALDTRIEHLLVDEFQDTSFVQWDLLVALTRGWSEGDGRTLFLVGDPMQSIYRFRDANLRLFLTAQSQRRIGGVALEALKLSANFRSQPRLVAWINAAFPSVLPPTDDPLRGAVAFTAAQAARPEAFEPGVTLDLVLDDRREAEAVVTRVRAALATDAQTIAVLVRKRADLDAILPALRGAGIAFAAVELDRLSERQPVLDLVALAHALVQPDDRASWLALLRAPWCGLTLFDLFALVETCGERPLLDAVAGDAANEVRARLSADGRWRLERFAAAVVPALRDRGRTPLASSVRATWLALGGPACVAEAAIDLPAADRVFALIAEHAIGADLPDWPAFAAALSALYAESDVDAATRVRILTLHKAKGLEFDVVVMPGLTRAPGTSQGQLLLWRERQEGLLLAPMRARDRPRGEDDSVYAYLRALDGDEDDAELRRLLYVGCTRAKRSLHLAAVLGTERDAGDPPRWKPPRRGTLLAALWPALEAPTPPEEAVATPATRTRVTGVPLTRLPRSWRLPPPPAAIALPPAPAVRDADEAIEFDWVRESARQVGIVAHRILRRMADEGLDRWTSERIMAERPRIERELAQAGFTGAEAAAAVEQVRTALERTIADPRGRWLFDPRHGDARSEYALTEWRNGAFVHRVLDRSFVDQDGTRWIVDFKLSRHEGAGLDAFLDRERERYAAQLEGYAATMRALDARPIRLGLYFPLLGGWREWDG